MVIKKNLFSLRHLIIHEGKSVPKTFGIVAIRLAVFTIIHYCYASKKFNSRTEFLAYLDAKISLENIYKISSFELLLKRWSDIELDSRILDPLIYSLYHHFINDGTDISGLKNAFYKLVHTYAKARQINIHDSFLKFNILLPLKFKCFDDFESFNAFQPALDFDIDALLNRIKKFGHYFNKYKL
jgi:hypothetical protein